MRVALVTHTFPSPTHPYITEWVRQLCVAGIDVTVITEHPAYMAARRELLAESDLSNRVLPLNALSKPIQAMRYSLQKLTHGTRTLKQIARTRHILQEEHRGRWKTAARKLYEYMPILDQHFDIVHFNAPQIAVRRFELARIFGAKSLVSFRGQDMTFYEERYDRLLEQADHLHFISQHLLDLARKRGFRGENYTLIPPMVDTSFFCPPPQQATPKPDQPFCLFTAARLEWMKGFEYALLAVALLVKRGLDVHYYVAGDGEFREAVIYTIAELGLQSRVHLLGWLEPREIRDWLWRSDVYVLASVEEAFNNSVLQAQACGVPVVCSDAGGLPENIADGVTGFLAARRDAWDLAEKIETMLRDADLRHQMGQRASRRVREQFNLSQFLGQYTDFYERIFRT